MADKQKTAVEWLITELRARYVFNFEDVEILEQAKEMEREQMKKVYTSPINTNEDGNLCIKTFEQYYNETYSK